MVLAKEELDGAQCVCARAQEKVLKGDCTFSSSSFSSFERKSLQPINPRFLEQKKSGTQIYVTMEASGKIASQGIYPSSFGGRPRDIAPNESSLQYCKGDVSASNHKKGSLIGYCRKKAQQPLEKPQRFANTTAKQPPDLPS